MDTAFSEHCISMSKLDSHHQLLEAQQLGLVHDGEGEAAGQKRDAEEDQHGPEVANLKQTKISFEFVIYNCPPAGTGTG